MESFHFRINPSLHVFNSDEKMIYRFENIENDYVVFFKMHDDDDDEEEISIKHSLEEVTEALALGYWIITD